MGAWRCAAVGNLCLFRRLRGVRAMPSGTKCGPCPTDDPDVDMVVAVVVVVVVRWLGLLEGITWSHHCWRSH